MRLLGFPLVVLVGSLTILAPVATVLLWRRRTARGPGGLRRSLVGGAAVVFCQLLAVLLTFVVVNRSYGFYTSWSDLVGVGGPPASITSQSGAVDPGDGSTMVLPVVGTRSHTRADLLVWLPPGYHAPANAATRYPVLVVLPGQPSGVATMFTHFDFGTVASKAIAAGQVKPFVAVFPPLMIKPPRDTECTDIPKGPAAESWLSHDVPEAVRRDLRVTSDPRHWGIAGWSTGGFCAAKLLFRSPGQFSAAVGLGGYYRPITDNTTGNLFGGSKIRYDENSPLWLYQQHGMPAGHSLLLVTGRQDPESWPDSEPMLTATRNDPSVYSLVFPTGGHNYRNYRDYLDDALAWLSQRGVLA